MNPQSRKRATPCRLLNSAPLFARPDSREFAPSSALPGVPEQPPERGRERDSERKLGQEMHRNEGEQDLPPQADRRQDERRKQDGVGRPEHRNRIAAHRQGEADAGAREIAQ